MKGSNQSRVDWIRHVRFEYDKRALLTLWFLRSELSMTSMTE